MTGGLVMNGSATDFERRLSSLGAAEWAQLDRWQPDARWDSAWEQVLGAGGGSMATPAMDRARAHGAPVRAGALAGAAAAALALEHRLEPAHVEALYRPFATMLPRETPPRQPSPVARPAPARARLLPWR